jgi:hypothetical protein
VSARAAQLAALQCGCIEPGDVHLSTTSAESHTHATNP